MQFDQVALEDQRLEVGFAQQDVKIVDVGDHRVHLRRMDGITKITADPVLQVHSFSDVYDGAFPVFHQVAAR